MKSCRFLIYRFTFRINRFFSNDLRCFHDHRNGDACNNHGEQKTAKHQHLAHLCFFTPSHPWGCRSLLPVMRYHCASLFPSAFVSTLWFGLGIDIQWNFLLHGCHQWRCDIAQRGDFQQPTAAWAHDALPVMIPGNTEYKTTIRTNISTPTPGIFHRLRHENILPCQQPTLQALPIGKIRNTSKNSHSPTDQISFTGKFVTSSRTFSASAVER